MESTSCTDSLTKQVIESQENSQLDSSVETNHGKTLCLFSGKCRVKNFFLFCVKKGIGFFDCFKGDNDLNAFLDHQFLFLIYSSRMDCPFRLISVSLHFCLASLWRVPNVMNSVFFMLRTSLL